MFRIWIHIQLALGSGSAFRNRKFSQKFSTFRKLFFAKSEKTFGETFAKMRIIVSTLDTVKDNKISEQLSTDR
jgi:hypothetical protein